jgi:C1A family cysteine protease
VHKVVDWRNHHGINAVTPIQDQDQCGACTGFATIALLESMLLIERGMVADLSEAEFFFCAGGSCNTGLWEGYAFVRALNPGAVRDNFLPYTANSKTSSQPCPNLPNNIRVKATYESNFITDQSRKIYIDQVGPMLATFIAYEDFEDYFYFGTGIYSHVYGKKKEPHSVLVIGYDDIERCWICKNSWGLGFSGNQGFFRMAYDSKCDFGTWAFKGLNTLVLGSNF